MNAKANTYAEVNRTWKKGDVVELVMDMPVCLLEAHPLAEEIRNQVVVKRGPLVYCLESMDIANGEKIDNILIPADIKLTPKKTTIEGSSIVALEGKRVWHRPSLGKACFIVRLSKQRKQWIFV